MKKRTSIPGFLMMGISCLILMIGMTAFTACKERDIEERADISQVETEDTESKAAYTMRVESVKPEGVELTITNNTDEEILYGTDYFLKRYEDDKWMDIDTLMLGFRFNRGFYMIPARSSVSVEFNWEGLYTPLSTGEYVISKTVLQPEQDGNYTQVTLYADFIIDD